MYVAIQSAIVVGVTGVGVSVEVDIASGLPQINVVGLPDSAVRESVERVRSAIKNAGHRFPLERITINLAPADIKKEGTCLDLAIALGILAASGQIEQMQIHQSLIIGELALNGQIRPINGILAMLEFAKSNQINHIILPHENIQEASLISDLMLCPLQHLSDLSDMQFFSSHQLRTSPIVKEEPNPSLDLADIVGQNAAKRALLIAAAGRHNLAVMGPPGVGKTMLMRRLPTILPNLDESSALEVTKIYSIIGKMSSPSQFMHTPPFRSPHHSISAGGLVGGGSPPKPGEITLSHHGVLFLDELPEFSRQIIELLRQPLEERVITISRARASYTFPAHFLLAVSFNPCPCGYYGYETETHPCHCSALLIQRYLSKLSGPLMDRIDLQLEMTRPSNLAAKQDNLTSAEYRKLVTEAYHLQKQRNQQFGVTHNSDLKGPALKKVAKLSSEANELLDQAFNKLALSFRAYEKVIKIARTIADLSYAERIEIEHISEALQYRKLDLQR